MFPFFFDFVFVIHIQFRDSLHHLLFLDDLLFAVYPLLFLILDYLHPDFLDLELDAAQLDDIVLL